MIVSDPILKQKKMTPTEMACPGGMDTGV